MLNVLLYGFILPHKLSTKKLSCFYLVSVFFIENELDKSLPKWRNHAKVCLCGIHSTSFY